MGQLRDLPLLLARQHRLQQGIRVYLVDQQRAAGHPRRRPIDMEAAEGRVQPGQVRPHRHEQPDHEPQRLRPRLHCVSPPPELQVRDRGRRLPTVPVRHRHPRKHRQHSVAAQGHSGANRYLGVSHGIRRNDQHPPGQPRAGAGSHPVGPRLLKCSCIPCRKHWSCAARSQAPYLTPLGSARQTFHAQR